jgi:hypothetical protein
VRPTNSAEGIPVDGKHMVFVAYPDPSDPRRTYSPIQAATRSILTDDALQESQYQSMTHGIWPKVVVRAGRLEDPRGGQAMRPVLTPEQRTELREAIKNAYSRPENHAEPVIVDGLIEEIMPFTRSVSEMDFPKSAELLKARIMQVTGTNPAIIGELAGVNRATAAVADGHLCKYSLNPIATLLSEGFTHTVAPLYAGNSEKLVIWIEKCQPADSEMQLKQWQVGAAAVTRNEYRRNILNLEPLDDERGEELMGGMPPALAEDQQDDQADKDDASERTPRDKSFRVKSQKDLNDVALEVATRQSDRLAKEMADDLSDLFGRQVEDMIIKVGQLKPTMEDEFDAKTLAGRLVDRPFWTSRLKELMRRHMTRAALTGYASMLSLAELPKKGWRLTSTPFNTDPVAGLFHYVVPEIFEQDAI